MTRKLISTLRAQLASTMPDNLVGAITPAIQRALITDMFDSMVPAFGAMYSVGSQGGIALPAAGAVLKGFYTADEQSAAGAFVFNRTNGTIQIPAGFEAYRFQFKFQIDIDGLPNNANVTIGVGLNGALSAIEMTQESNANGSRMTFSAFGANVNALPPNSLVSIFGSCTGSPNVTVAAASLSAILNPTESALP